MHPSAPTDLLLWWAHPFSMTVSHTVHAGVPMHSVVSTLFAQAVHRSIILTSAMPFVCLDCLCRNTIYHLVHTTHTVIK